MATEQPTDQNLRDLYARSLDMLAVAADGYLVHANPAWTEQLGWSNRELTTTRLLDFIHPDDVAETKVALRELIDGVASTTFRSRFRHHDGTYRVLRWSLQPHDGVVYVGARDISVYIELRERAERSEAIATSVLQTAADPIIVINTSGEIVDANAATTTLFGYPLSDLMGHNVSMLMPEPYHSEHDDYLRRYLTDGNARIIGIGREVTARRADGTTFPMALAVSEARTDQAHLFTGIIHDLTERNDQRDALVAANNDLESRVADRTQQLEQVLGDVQRSNRDLEQYAYVASHDLQAPLRNVRQGLELLDEHLHETSTGFDAEAQELRDLVVASVSRMEDLITGLLAYSRFQQSPVEQRELLDMDQLVGDVATMLRPEIDAVDGSISVGPLPNVTAVDIQIRRIFQNLIENAIRYRSPDRDLHIEIAARPTPSSHIAITVSDNGTGIEPAHHERIFELFRRGHSGYDGVGLGLAICKRIVEGHGGRVWVESDTGQGATFGIELPT